MQCGKHSCAAFQEISLERSFEGGLAATSLRNLHVIAGSIVWIMAPLWSLTRAELLSPRMLATAFCVGVHFLPSCLSGWVLRPSRLWLRLCSLANKVISVAVTDTRGTFDISRFFGVTVERRWYYFLRKNCSLASEISSFIWRVTNFFKSVEILCFVRLIPKSQKLYDTMIIFCWIFWGVE